MGGTRRIALKGFEGSNLLEETLPGLFSPDGAVKVSASRSGAEGFSILGGGSSYEVSCSSVSSLMAALGDIVSGDAKADGSRQSFAFEFRAVMHDCSRNGVPSIEFLKGAVAKLALLGINAFTLYTEDTFEVEGEPLAGYGRGAYSQSELKELSEFGDALGVELFPCVQTLGHLQEILKHDKFAPLRDNNAVLNVLKEESYAFVRRLLESASKPYKSKRVHIGTDEPWGLGRGAALDFEKPRKPGELYAVHVAKAVAICEELGLKPAIWGDYILGHSGEAAMDESQEAVLPRSAAIDYWNYYSLDQARYESDIDKYLALGCELMVSPGVWNWNRFLPSSEFAMKTTETFMRAAHRKGIAMAMTTMWGDDGQECFFDANWPVLSHFAAWCRQAEPDSSSWSLRSERICGIPAVRARLYSALQRPGLGDSALCQEQFHLSKALFYDDPLMGYAAMSVEGFECGKELLRLAEEAASAKGVSPCDAKQLKLAALFAKIAGGKFELFNEAKRAYAASDLKRLAATSPEALAIASDLKRFKALFSKLWLEERKPFGLEVVEARLAGLESRMRTFAARVESFVDGALDSLPELELERRPEIKPGFYHIHAKVASMCPLSHNRAF